MNFHQRQRTHACSLHIKETQRDDAENANAGGFASRSRPGNQHGNAACGNKQAGAR